MSCIDALSDEIVSACLLLLDPMVLWTTIGLVCSRFFRLSRDWQLWKLLLQPHLPLNLALANDLFTDRNSVKTLVKLLNVRQLCSRWLGNPHCFNRNQTV
jgi:hypothetical protein